MPSLASHSFQRVSLSYRSFAVIPWNFARSFLDAVRLKRGWTRAGLHTLLDQSAQGGRLHYGIDIECYAARRRQTCCAIVVHRPLATDRR